MKSTKNLVEINKIIPPGYSLSYHKDVIHLHLPSTDSKPYPNSSVIDTAPIVSQLETDIMNKTNKIFHKHF